MVGQAGHGLPEAQLSHALFQGSYRLLRLLQAVARIETVDPEHEALQIKTAAMRVRQTDSAHGMNPHH
jgi:hypothetical protein